MDAGRVAAVGAVRAPPALQGRVRVCTCAGRFAAVGAVRVPHALQSRVRVSTDAGRFIAVAAVRAPPTLQRPWPLCTPLPGSCRGVTSGVLHGLVVHLHSRHSLNTTCGSRMTWARAICGASTAPRRVSGVLHRAHGFFRVKRLNKPCRRAAAALAAALARHVPAAQRACAPAGAALSPEQAVMVRLQSNPNPNINHQPNPCF